MTFRNANPEERKQVTIQVLRDLADSLESGTNSVENVELNAEIVTTGTKEGWACKEPTGRRTCTVVFQQA